MTKKTERYVVGPDLDLDVEDFQYQGERLTNERAEQIAEETLAELRRRNLIPGGKSLLRWRRAFAPACSSGFRRICASRRNALPRTRASACRRWRGTRSRTICVRGHQGES